MRIWSLRVETSRYIGLPFKALENSTERFALGLTGNYLKVRLSVTLKSHVTSNTSTAKMKEHKMRVKHEDICREFLVNMLRVSRFFRPAFDRQEKK